MSKIMREFHLLVQGKFRETLKLRLVSKLWKDGFDILTLNKKLLLVGLTPDESIKQNIDELTHNWNPFPSRIVKLKLCFGHDDPEVAGQHLENTQENLLMERFGEHIRILQVSVQHADCSEAHLAKVLSTVRKTVRGLVISEMTSPYRFSKIKSEPSENPETLSTSPEESFSLDLGLLDNLQYLKLDDSDTKLKYSNLYKLVIQNAPILQHLEINGYYHLDMDVVRLLATTNLPITHLKIDAEDPNVLEILETLDKAQFSLKYLSLKISGFGDATECVKCSSLLHNILRKSGSTLERLELKLSWFETSENPQAELLHVFPSSRYLKKLEKLKLVGFSGQLDFLTDLIALKTLMVVDYNPESQNKFSSDDSFKSIIPNLETVFLPRQMTLYSADLSYKNMLQNFMYEGKPEFKQKYCGLYQEIFP